MILFCSTSCSHDLEQDHGFMNLDINKQNSLLLYSIFSICYYCTTVGTFERTHICSVQIYYLHCISTNTNQGNPKGLPFIPVPPFMNRIPVQYCISLTAIYRTLHVNCVLYCSKTRMSNASTPHKLRTRTGILRPTRIMFYPSNLELKLTTTLTDLLNLLNNG